MNFKMLMKKSAKAKNLASTNVCDILPLGFENSDFRPRFCLFVIQSQARESLKFVMYPTGNMYPGFLLEGWWFFIISDSKVVCSLLVLWIGIILVPIRIRIRLSVSMPTRALNPSYTPVGKSE